MKIEMSKNDIRRFTAEFIMGWRLMCIDWESDDFNRIATIPEDYDKAFSNYEWHWRASDLKSYRRTSHQWDPVTNANDAALLREKTIEKYGAKSYIMALCLVLDAKVTELLENENLNSLEDSIMLFVYAGNMATNEEVCLACLRALPAKTALCAGIL